MLTTVQVKRVIQIGQRLRIIEFVDGYHRRCVIIFFYLITQGLMHYLSACHTDLVWKSFGSWLRTIRRGVAPSERFVALTMRNTLDEFLIVGTATNSVAKFITE